MTYDCAKIIPAFLRETTHFPSVGTYSQPPAAGTRTILDRGTSFIVSAILPSVRGRLGCAFLGELVCPFVCSPGKVLRPSHPRRGHLAGCTHLCSVSESPWTHLGTRWSGLGSVPSSQFFLWLGHASFCDWRMSLLIFSPLDRWGNCCSLGTFESVQNDLENSSPME